MRAPPVGAMAAVIPSAGAAATAFAGRSSGDGTLNLQRSYPSAVAGLSDAPLHRQRHRRLQEATACTGDFTITSPLWPDSTGCYAETAENMFEFTAADGTVWITTVIAMYNSADSPSVWVVGELITVDGEPAVDPHCHSESDVTVHAHPADEEFWLCDIDNTGTGTAWTEVTADEFDTSCGCEGGEGGEGGGTTEPPVPGGGEATTPAPTAGSRGVGGGDMTPAPAAAATPPTPAAGTTTPAPAAAATPPTPAAGADTPAPAAAATPPTPASGTATPAPTAAAAPPTPAAGADTAAPAGVPSEQPVQGPTAEPGTTTSTTSEEEGSGSASVTSDTPNGICGELESLEIATSNELLVSLEGCYEETGHEYHEEGGHFFTITGSDLRGQYGVFPGYVDEASTDARWFIGFVAVSAEETIVYCISHEAPAAGHPSTAQWYCDADGLATFPLMDESEFSVSCGCSDDEETTAPPSEGGATEAPGHGGATTAPSAGGATESPAHGGATAGPTMGGSGDRGIGATEPPAHGGATTPPSAGTTSPPAVGGATTPPAAGGATLPPAHGGATTPPAAGATTPPAHGGATTPPAHAGHTVSPTASPVVDTGTTAPAAPTPGATLEPIVDGSTAPAAATDHDDHTTSAGEGHTTSEHDDAAGGHSGTPSPTTVARGIIGPDDTPAPVGADAEAVGVSGATRAAGAGAWADLGASATARAAVAVGAVVLFAAVA